MAAQLMEGSEAIAAAMTAAGCRFFAGYPMTPFTEVLEHMAKKLPPVGGVCMNAESELEAVGMAWGAAATGTRSATGSTGQGLSLMQESITELSIARLPVVVLNMARSQAEYWQATRGGGHGDWRRIVLAPMDVVEATEASPVSPMDEAFELIEACVEELFPEAVVAPYVMMAATDSRFFTDVCERVYRFTPFRMSKAQRAAIHAADERIGVADYARGVAWYRRLIERLPANARLIMGSRTSPEIGIGRLRAHGRTRRDVSAPADTSYFGRRPGAPGDSVAATSDVN